MNRKKIKRTPDKFGGYFFKTLTHIKYNSNLHFAVWKHTSRDICCEETVYARSTLQERTCSYSWKLEFLRFSRIGELFARPYMNIILISVLTKSTLRVIILSLWIRPVGQAAKTPPSQGGNMGSIPVRVTKKRSTLLCASFFICSERELNPRGLFALRKTSDVMFFSKKGETF